MKKNVKRLLFASLIICLLGIIICSLSLILAAVNDINLFENTDISPSDSYSIKFSEIDKSGNLSLSKLSVRGEDIDIEIRSTTEENYIYFNSPDEKNTTCLIENGILKITDTVPFYILGLSVIDNKPQFTGFRNVFSQGLYSHTDKSVIIYINEKTVFDDIDINIGVGAIDISDITAANIDLRSSLGDISIKNSVIKEKTTVQCGAGNVFIDKCEYVFADLLTSSGNIDVDASGRKTNCETTLGNITVYTPKQLIDYSVRATVSHGKILFENEAYGEKEYTGNDGAENTLWLKTISGNISLYNSVTNE